MRNPLQEQLLKAGLVKKGQVAQVVRDQTKARHGKQPAAPTAEQREVERLRQDKAERDRVLAAERNAQAKTRELRLQARQLVVDGKVVPEGERVYRFADGAAFRSLLTSDTQSRLLATGALVIARLDDGYALLPRTVADKVATRDPETIVVDHARTTGPADTADDDAYYRGFEVPDDLVW
ncbi:MULTISPECIES: DUF2058 domain-containing protein [Luteimonas]|uniref:DUF2058 domain-containing protein n=1 Tax=Luteimonas TaxID=83614 RepID=UPI000C7D38B9|nr:MULTISPECIES: DUF2058 domain-containing protein [Luteimonas]